MYGSHARVRLYRRTHAHMGGPAHFVARVHARPRVVLVLRGKGEIPAVPQRLPLSAALRFDGAFGRRRRAEHLLSSTLGSWRLHRPRGTDSRPGARPAGQGEPRYACRCAARVRAPGCSVGGATPRLLLRAAEAPGSVCSRAASPATAPVSAARGRRGRSCVPAGAHARSRQAGALAAGGGTPACPRARGHARGRRGALRRARAPRRRCNPRRCWCCRCAQA
jgi:hypothetical protein